MKKSVNIKIGGAAGEGIKSVGLILSKTLMRAGFCTFDYTEYPSLIRGGHNTYQTHTSSQKVYSQVKLVDLLIALNRETIDFHQDELNTRSLVLYDPDEIKIDKKEKLIGKYLPIPFIKLATQKGGLPVMANNVALGAVMFLIGLSPQILKAVVGEIFSGKGGTIIKQNQQAVQAGFDYAQQKFATERIQLEKATKKEDKILLSGNEAMALGAISGGLKFYAAYPMTPVTGILHYLAARAKEYKLVVKHAEDEISVINLALGASFAGVRAMVATSGGGFCLMTEGLSMAGEMELPLVVVEGSRSGPSSGMPTWHDQGDLKFVINASHGEFPRIVLAPGDVREAFTLTHQALLLAEKYQLPVIILTDKYLAETAQSILKPQTNWQNNRYGLVSNPGKTFKRYQLIATGISGRSVPGQPNGVYLCNSYEHDEYGFATEDASTRIKMVEKRLKKFVTLASETEKMMQPVFGNPQAKIGLISWGSNKGPILQALEAGIEASFLHLNVLWPFPKKQVQQFLKGKTKVIDIECNSTAQLASLVKEHTGYEIKNKLLKYDGRPFYPEEIVEKIKMYNK
jgi:2-oxoglutarate ferredoxin oxidoreductase subunit alpha